MEDDEIQYILQKLDEVLSALNDAALHNSDRVAEDHINAARREVDAAKAEVQHQEP